MYLNFRRCILMLFKRWETFVWDIHSLNWLFVHKQMFHQHTYTCTQLRLESKFNTMTAIRLNYFLKFTLSQFTYFKQNTHKYVNILMIPILVKELFLIPFIFSFTTNFITLRNVTTILLKFLFTFSVKYNNHFAFLLYITYCFQ